MNKEKPINIEIDTFSIDNMLSKLEKREEERSYPVIIEKMAEMLSEKSSIKENEETTNKFLVNAKRIIEDYQIA